MPTEPQTNEANAEIETQPVTVETKINQNKQLFNINLNTYMPFYIFRSLNHYVLFLLKDSFLFNLFFSV